MVYQFIGGRILRSDGTRQFGECALHLVLRLQQQQFRLRQIHGYEADVQFRTQFVVIESRYLVHQQLARSHRLLRHLHQPLRAQRPKVSLVDAHQHVVLGGLRGLRGGAGLQTGTGHQVRRASGIGNQLAERDTLPDAVEQAGIGEKAGADACPRIGLRTGNIPRQRRKICRPGFVDPLVHGRRDVLRRQNLGVIFQRQRFGILQIQLRRGSGLRRKAAGYAPRQ